MNARQLARTVRDKTLARFLRDEIPENWVATRSGGGHIKLRSPGGRLVVIAGTASDWRATANNRAAVRRAIQSESEGVQ